ncbi:MAG: TonB-dependent receptor [Gemmatimonadaceae bacterium]
MTWYRRVAAWLPAARVLATVAALLLPVRGTAAQDRVLAGTDSTLVRAVSRSALLTRPVSVNLVDATVEGALREVAAQASLRLSYSSDIIPPAHRVTLSRQQVSAGEVIRDILRNTELDVVVSPSGYVVLVRSPSRVLPSVAALFDETSDNLAEVALRRPVVRPQVMDRVLVMGTPNAGAPERSLASAVSVISGNQIAQSGATSMEQLFRSGIPGVVAWDLGISGPFAQIGSVRGSSSFSANYLKTYVDGVELASPYLLFAIDPYSVERIEVIRGPQGSALYGSDAISGVVQVVTRKGRTSSKWRPQVDAQLTAGLMQSRFNESANGTQRHSGMLSTGGGVSSFGFGGTYEESGAIVAGASSGYRGTYGGGRTVLGPLRLDATLRYADVRFVAPSNPLFGGSQISNTIRPLLGSQRIENETYGITADFQPVEWWRQTLVLGIDRHAGAIAPQREPATVADALLGATQERASKASLRYSTALRLIARPGATVSALAGFEQSDLMRERLGFRSDLSGTGQGLAPLYNDEVRNRGIFGQLKLDVSNSLFLTAGLRGERNSNFGEKFGTAYAPMLGAAFTRDVGESATLKLRAAYGKGIRPPQPNARRAIQTLGFRQLANPLLEPESQRGIEGGVELYLGDRANFSITTYNQDAEGLIQQVVANQRTNARTIQYQNVGRIHNSGVEFEGTVRGGNLRGDLSFSVTDSRVLALSSTYTGDLRVGDRVPEVPTSSGLASISVDTWRVRTTAGANYIGSWVGYNWLDFYGAELGGSGAGNSLRNYWVTYPSLTRPFVGLTYVMRRDTEWYLRVDNLTNVQRNERDNLQVTQGRTGTFGLRISR